MSLLWSSEEIKNVLKADTGFRELLSSFPQFDGDFIAEILENPASFEKLLNLLPPQIKSATQATLSELFDTPQKALNLFEQCRFFEARALLEKTITLYSSPVSTQSKSLDQATSFVSQRLQALCLCLLGEVEWELGNPEKAGLAFQHSLEKAEQLGDQATIAKALHGRGNYLWHLADFEQGIECCTQALELLDKCADQWNTTVKLLSSLSNMLDDIGQHDIALDYAEQAIDLCLQAEDQQTLPLALNSRALLLTRHNEYDQAISNLEWALDIAQQNRNIRQEALLANNLAMCLLCESTADPNREIAASQLVIALKKSHLSHSQSLLALVTGNLGIIHQLSGHLSSAEEMFRKAANIYHKIGARASEAEMLTQLGNHFRDYIEDSGRAQSAYRDAINLTEQIRSGLNRESYRIGFTQETIEPYWMLIDSLVKNGSADAAVSYVERAKSRSMLEFMSQPFCDNKAQPQSSENLQKAMQLLLEREEILKNLTGIAEKDAVKTATHDERSSGTTFESDRTLLLELLTEKELSFKKVCHELRTVDPESAALISVSPLTVEEIRETLDRETCFLEFFQSEDVLNIFVVSKDSVNVEQIDFPLATAQEKLEKLLTNLRSETTRDVRSHEYIRSVKQPLTLFYDQLIRPLLPHLLNCRRLIISPHLLWHYLPFQALFDQEKKEYLCDQYEISYTPSASVLQLCQQKNLLKKESAIIFARDNGDLPYVNQEGALLEGAFYPAGKLFSGKEAHLTQLECNHQTSDVIHFACHGYFDQEQPVLSGIDIPPSADEERGTFLFDLFSLNLKSSLVTLSACDSGLSHFTSADELTGLSRGLFYAGAAAALLSLWQVADQSTCKLMEIFYWHYIKQNKSKTESLKLAMQTVKAKAQDSHPFYWAPFVVMGDGR